jgi:hypothetical protein
MLLARLAYSPRSRARSLRPRVLIYGRVSHVTRHGHAIAHRGIWSGQWQRYLALVCRVARHGWRTVGVRWCHLP